MPKEFAFEVHGKVQGVYFRKNTQAKGKELGLVGWCMNTKSGTVVGVAQGDDDTQLENLKHWLANVGSKASRIDRCDITKEREIPKLTFSDFGIKK
mmetsp:Transcript_35467/g.42715  ORF Transcript_35467/g.42715 Transcript_35467/m.42715 type:complete len:96 (+) Transcript_35467:259-546(+)